ncbi:MAG: DUF2344 domain-containing protein [Clostridiales bacterium]|nr:DUF2344 domain-containing protein [Clostridiales bacterium]
MSRYCLIFSKEGNLRFISHLDLMRLFQRAFKRARYNIKYSSGFNPHPKMCFAQPLSLGYAGLREYLDFEVDPAHPLDPAAVPAELNALLPPGVAVSECRPLPMREDGINYRTLAALAERGAYDLYLEKPEGWTGDVKALAEAFLAQESILAVKRIKKTKKPGEVEIRNMIHSLEYVGEVAEDCEISGISVKAGELQFKAVVASGSGANLNPEHLLQAFCSFAGLPFDKTMFTAVRTELYFMEEAELNAKRAELRAAAKEAAKAAEKNAAEA